MASEAVPPRITKKQEFKKNHIIEEGRIYFFYKPKVQTEHVAGLKDVQSLELLLHREITFDKLGKAKHEPLFRLIMMGSKTLPEINLYGKGTWGYVTDVETDVDVIDKVLLEKRYTTKRGEHFQGCARPIGEGKYFIVDDGLRTHLVYEMEVPHQLNEVQTHFHIPQEGSYVISVKNPHVTHPPNVASTESKQITYEEQLDVLFKDHRWIPCEPTDVLNVKNCEILLLAGGEHPDFEFGIKFKELAQLKKNKTEQDALKELHLEGKGIPTGPMKEGVESTFE